MRRYALLLGAVALMASVTLPAAATPKHHHNAECGKSRGGWEVIYDGSKRCFERWRYAGGASITRQRDGTLKTGPGDPGLGVLWYAARPYGDFELKLQLRDDAPDPAARANSGVQVRFPAPHRPVPGCPTTFNGSEQNNAGWIAVNCGHEIQVNDSPDGGTADPRKTGSIYGFADLDSAHSHPVPKGEWYDLEISVVNQHYTVIRDGRIINEYENVPGVILPGRPNDPKSDARGLVGYVGLQSHGGAQDVVSFRDVRINDLSDRD
jgi:3-keto-disaccharide hydrolase